MSTDLAALEGVTVEFLATLLVPIDFSMPFDPISRVYERAETLTLDAAILEASLDRNGDSFWSLIDDEDGQIRRFGRRVVRRAGSTPVEPWDGPGHRAYAAAYWPAWRALRALPPGPERNEATVAFAKRFPTSPEDGQELMRFTR